MERSKARSECREEGRLALACEPYVPFSAVSLLHAVPCGLSPACQTRSAQEGGEKEAVLRLLVSPTCRSLRSVFRMQPRAVSPLRAEETWPRTHLRRGKARRYGLRVCIL
jgi:hypothetical protein